MKLPQALESVVEALQSLPGVGRKSAQRMVISLLKDGATSMSRLGSVLSDASQKLCFCSLCGVLQIRRSVRSVPMKNGTPLYFS